MSEPDWPCEAYGPEGRDHGVLCFAAEPGERACASRAECAAVMAAERQRVFRRIQELAAAGDPAGEYLAGEFTGPGQLLGGEEDRSAEAPLSLCRRCGQTTPSVACPSCDGPACARCGRCPACEDSSEEERDG